MDEQTPPHRAPVADGQGQRQLFLALALLLAYGLFIQQPAWNEYSRFDLVRAVVEEARTTIDSFHENTGDKAFKDGHYYSDKAPGTAILGIPVYATFRAVSAVTGDPSPDQVDGVAAVAWAISGLSTVALVVLLVRFLIPLTGEAWALFMGIALGVGSIAFPFATMLFGHALSAATLFAAFWLLHRWRRTAGRWEPVAAGFLAGWAVLTEIPVGLGVAVLAGYALWLGRGVALRFLIGGLPVALLLGGYNWLVFGSPVSLGYQYATLFGEQNAQGIVSIVWPSWTVFADLLLNPRGLLSLAPWFTLAPLGLLAARDRSARPEVIVCAVMCVAFLTYNSGALNPFGGWTPGPRYLVPMLPFATILVALAPRRLRIVTVLLVAYSVATMIAATATRPNAEELYENPLLQLWVPRLLSGDLAETLAWRRFGLGSVWPLVLLAVGVVVALAAGLATTRRDRAAEGLSVAGRVVLALLIVAVALPIPAGATIALPGAATNTGSSAIRIRAAGAYRVTAGGNDRMLMWARIENDGGPVTGTRIEYRVTPPDGGP
ncbi:MAG TPA: hypothetical protein VKB30_09705, partial [Candidatus Limnocylindrales bacterium]|nr:hypothetical protein [Candidatus Limnocylindrales bacterium]